MKNKKMIAAIAGAVALILVCVLASQQGTSSNAGDEYVESGIASADKDVDQTGAAAVESVTGTESTAEVDSTSQKDENQSGISNATDSNKTDAVGNDDTADVNPDETSEGVDQTYVSGAVIDDGQSASSSHSISSQNASWKNLDDYYDGTNTNPERSPTPKIADDLAFPYTIPDRDLVVRRIASYDGIFLEDGSDSGVEGIAVIILENTGTRAVEYAEIMFSGTGGQYTFECSDIPAGSVAVVQEKSAAAYKEGIYWRKCECATSMLDELELSDDVVKVTENEDGALLVENISDEDIACVRIFYKFYDVESDAYVGGITYMVKVSDLEAGGQTTVTPSHYESGYSQVMMVRTYDTAEG